MNLEKLCALDLRKTLQVSHASDLNHSLERVRAQLEDSLHTIEVGHVQLRNALAAFDDGLGQQGHHPGQGIHITGSGGIEPEPAEPRRPAARTGTGRNGRLPEVKPSQVDAGGFVWRIILNDDA